MYKNSLKIEHVKESVENDVNKFNNAGYSGYVRVGPHGYFYPDLYCTDGVKIYNMSMRSDDIIVATFPRSGTTWSQELVWMICNNLDYKESASVALLKRYNFIEMSLLCSDVIKKQLKEENKNQQWKLNVIDNWIRCGADAAAVMPSPRYFKTHLPLSLLPPNTIDTCKMVYIARNPLDVAVSFYHLNRLTKAFSFFGDFKTFWRFFKKDMCIYTPFFPHVKEAWNLRNHPNMLFLFYDDMLKDLQSNVRRVAKFFNKLYTDEQIANLCDHLTFKNFKNNKSCNLDDLMRETKFVNLGEASYIRKGVSGGWREYFDEEMTKEAEEWIAENLKDTDLRFPS